jgi:DNA processing protein
MPESKPELRDILLLHTIPFIGPGRVRRLLGIFESTGEILKAPLKRLMQIEGIDEKLARQLKSGVDEKQADKQLKLMAEKRIYSLSIWDPQYPPLLKRTNAPPVLLFYRGQLPETWPNCLGVVGTRMASHYGRTVTEKLVFQLADKGIAVISGMARGIDTVAHSSAIKRGGLTYAVLGCGADYIYPPENRKLYENIQKNGAVLSEFFIGTGPDGVNFPRRNRIISGMSLGVLIVEAGSKSGALITANYAIEQNREVFAVPGNITGDKSRGPNRLIQQGAKLVTSVEDILEEISVKLLRTTTAEKPLPPTLDEFEKKLMQYLSDEPKHIDNLVLELRESPAMVLSRLLTLELMGLVRQLAGKMFIRL